MEWTKHVERRNEVQDERKYAPNRHSGKGNTNIDDDDHVRTNKSVGFLQASKMGSRVVNGIRTST